VRTTEALPVQQRALAIAEAAYGPDHPQTAVALDNLGIALRSQERPADALPLQERALAISEAALGRTTRRRLPAWAASLPPSVTWAGPPTRCHWNSGSPGSPPRTPTVSAAFRRFLRVIRQAGSRGWRVEVPASLERLVPPRR
jgi:Tetratricopeptide repeat